MAGSGGHAAGGRGAGAGLACSQRNLKVKIASADIPRRSRCLWLYVLFAIILASGHAAAAKSAITSFPAPGFPTGIVTGADGALWFLDSYAPAIDRMSTAGTVKQYPLRAAAFEPSLIIRGRNNALWFVTQSGHVGTVTYGGKISEHRIPTQDPRSFAIAQSTNGSIWITTPGSASNDTRVFRYSEKDGFRPFRVPWREGFPFGITAGPDGAMWMTDNAKGIVARITDAGVFTVHHLPFGRAPAGIVTGPDGALWFTEEAGAIGRMTTSGQFKEYRVPTRGAFPDRITVGQTTRCGLRNGPSERSAGSQQAARSSNMR